jgi:hypothetical protein
MTQRIGEETEEGAGGQRGWLRARLQIACVSGIYLRVYYVHDNNPKKCGQSAQATTDNAGAGQARGHCPAEAALTVCCTMCRGPVVSKPRRPAQFVNNPPNAIQKRGGKRRGDPLPLRGANR